MSDSPEVTRAVRSLIKQRALAAASRVRRVLRPLVVRVRGKFRLVGSSVVVQVDQDTFLFTAAHVLDEGAHTPLFIGDTSGLVGLDGEQTTTKMPSSGKREDDKIDVGLVKLSASAREQLTDIAVLAVSDMDANETTVHRTPLRTHYLVMGFPASQANPSRSGNLVATKTFIYTATPTARDIYKKLSFAEETHVIVDFDKNRTMNMEGQHVAPDPNGVSGGGIWTLGESFDIAAQHLKLIGIGIEWPREKAKVLVGTRVPLFFEVLRKTYPDLSTIVPGTRLRVNVRYE